MSDKLPHLYVFTGSGGVGKTTLSAAWSLTLAEMGERVALITIDPAQRLAQSLGLARLEGQLTQTPISSGLWAMMLDREVTSRRLVERFAPSQDQAARIANNRYFKVFSRSLAGAQEMMAIHEVHEALHCGLYDAVVLDTPPAQHTLDLLDVPERLRVALDGPALKWMSSPQSRTKGRGWRAALGGLSKSMALKAFTRMTSAPFLEDLFEFINLFGGVLRELKERGGSLEDWLTSRHTSIWVIASPEQSTLTAADRVSEALDQRGYHAERWLVNRVPAILKEYGRPLDHENLMNIGQCQVNEVFGEQTPELSSLALSVWCEEVDRACDAADALQRHAYQSLFLIEELSKRLTPLEQVQALTKVLEPLWHEEQEKLRGD